MHVSPTLQLFHRELDEFGFSGVEVRRGQTKTEIIIRAAKAQDVLGEWVPRAAWSEALPALAEPPQFCLWWQPLPLLLQTLVPLQWHASRKQQQSRLGCWQGCLCLASEPHQCTAACRGGLTSFWGVVCRFFLMGGRREGPSHS